MTRRLAAPGRRRGSLTAVGLGITGITQTTPEAVGFMQRAERLFYLALDPLTEFWIQGLNAHATSLAGLYAPGKPRRRTYDEMSRRITAAAVAGHRVVAAFYGHPGVLVDVSRRAVAAVRRAGLEARVVPGISAEACLYADVGLDPGTQGVQGYEATDFLMYRRRIDPTSALILWQIGVLGDAGTRDPSERVSPRRLGVLVRRLLRHYPPAHRVVLYEAATFPGTPPLLVRVPLRRLAAAPLSPITTLYVPALPSRAPDPRIARWLA